jgi:hypothetical protein
MNAVSTLTLQERNRERLVREQAAMDACKALIQTDDLQKAIELARRALGLSAA